MIKYSTGGYRIINLQDEDIFEQMAEIITEAKPLLITGNIEYDTTDFITASSEIQINRDGNDNVISYRVPTGAVNHSDIDGRGEKDWWQYFTYVTPSGNNFVREKVSEVFNRDAQTIKLSFPSELNTSVKATSNMVDLFIIDEKETTVKCGTFNLIGNKVDVDRQIYITYKEAQFRFRIYGTITYNADTLMYDISLYYEALPFDNLTGDIDVSLLSDLVTERRKSDKLSYANPVTYNISNYRKTKVGYPEYIQLNVSDGSTFLGIVVDSDLGGVADGTFFFQPKIRTLGSHNYYTSIKWNDTESTYQLSVTLCTDAEPLYADKELYGDVKIGEHITVTDGVITPDIATKEQLGIVQVGDHIGVTDGVITPDIATKEQLGIVQVGDNIDVTDGVVSVPVGTESKLGVCKTSPFSGLNIYNGNISCNVVSLRHCNIPLDTEKEMTFESISWGSQLKDTKQYISIASSTVGFGDLTRRVKGTIIDENCFVAQQFSQEAEYINTTYFGGNVYDRSDLLADVTPRFLIKKVTIDSTDYFVRVPIMYNQEWRLLFDPKTYKQAPYLEGFCDFEINSDAWDKTNFIPEIEVGASGTKVMTYDTSTSQVVPMMKAFSVNITMPDGITYSIPSYELYVQDGKAYIVSVNIDLNQANPAVTDTFATFTFTRVF